MGRYGTVQRWAELILCTGGQRWYHGTVHRWADMVLCTGEQEQRGASGWVHRCSGKGATDDVGVGEGGGSGRYGSLCLTRMLRPDALTPHLHQPYPLLLLKASFALQNQSSSSRMDNCQPQRSFVGASKSLYDSTQQNNSEFFDILYCSSVVGLFHH